MKRSSTWNLFHSLIEDIKSSNENYQSLNNDIELDENINDDILLSDDIDNDDEDDDEDDDDDDDDEDDEDDDEFDEYDEDDDEDDDLAAINDFESLLKNEILLDNSSDNDSINTVIDNDEDYEHSDYSDYDLDQFVGDQFYYNFTDDEELINLLKRFNNLGLSN
eukprot:CAMPEP_0196766528 /NCGR_PEP_ID=MMETSP1095-20130614/26007_1 /TAXON_ID=96789 ORGANISM="Chromulina nebulosa, Strain UTEXLB2642" /NCGR_SAMPLE_ID=MMETSP1095 /ASSEMBLY_ACC=CAM_ASM_000446 /LENGTH=163 /DNA_ID=CAMNT_0042129011 /DNA_START=45 /DNA_END=533 /DNA_ORIENTATION=-